MKGQHVQAATKMQALFRSKQVQKPLQALLQRAEAQNLAPSDLKITSISPPALSVKASFDNFTYTALAIGSVVVIETLTTKETQVQL